MPVAWTQPARFQILVAAALVVSGLGSAQAYDLMQAYREALGNDAQLNSARASLDAATQRVPLVQAATRPSAAASAGVNRQHTDSSPSGGSSQFTSKTLGINAKYPLFRRQDDVRVEQTKLQLEVAKIAYEDAQQDLILRTAQGYFDVLSSANDLNSVRAQKRAISEQLAAAKRNFEVGTATITDEQEAQARFDLTVAQELAIQNDLEVQRAAMQLLTGKPVPDLADLRQGVELAGPQPANIKSWTNRAREESLGVRQALIGSEVARREIDKQRAGRYPTVDLVGSLSHARDPSAAAIGNRSNTAAIGVQLNIPLYTGGAIQAGIREASANLDKANADLEVAKRTTELGAYQAFLGLKSGLSQVKALEAAEQSSKLALDSNRLGYQVGVRINIDVLNAQQQLFSTQSDLAKARYDVLVNGLRLKATAGALNEQDLLKVSSMLEQKRVTKPAPSAPKAISK